MRCCGRIDPAARSHFGEPVSRRVPAERHRASLLDAAVEVGLADELGFIFEVRIPPPTSPTARCQF
jgi:hypothetical protein